MSALVVGVTFDNGAMPLDEKTRSPLLSSFYPSLDGLRAIAILSVFALHFPGSIFPSQIFQWGWVGVDIFFVVSGFLITGILWESLDRSDYFRNFYIRRSLRIFPLYYAVWLLFLLIGFTPWFRIFWSAYHLTLLAYLGNLFMSGGQLGHHANINVLAYQRLGSGHTGALPIGQFWSLCVEEQFYLVWPAVIWLVRSRSKLLWICFVVILAEPLIRAMYLHVHPEMLHAEGLYAPTYFRIDSLLIGAVVSLWLRGSSPSRKTVAWLSYSLLLIPAFVLAAIFAVVHRHSFSVIEDPVTVTIGFTLVALSAVGLLLFSITPNTLLSRALTNPVLSWIGRISYGLYVFMGPISGIVITEASRFGRFASAFVTIGGPVLTALLAWLSFVFLESPFLKLKSRLAPRRGAADDPPPYPQVQRLES